MTDSLRDRIEGIREQASYLCEISCEEEGKELGDTANVFTKLIEDLEGLEREWRGPTSDSNESHRKQRLMCADALKRILEQP